MTTSFWLIRHPEPESEAEGRCYGSLDWQLSAAGIQQAHAIAARLASERLAAIYSSPRRRCLEAAEILAVGRGPVRILDALRELDFGQFEGRRYDEIAELYPALYRQWMDHPTEVQFPGGESFQAMRARVIETASDLRARHAGESAALVTHGGANRILLAEALRIDPADIFRIAQRYGAINLIRYFDDEPVVELVNHY